ncbi:HAMP domain-containing histidine kinase [Oceanospirillum sp. D5]|uniref:histidine kinase n=1 Tax=Oceanospirillum sediminis TaxID=2760088 RepID=A0A839IQ52_9GAMM|nr:HAMP domain-containing histidine kinase [Oceanospirillum sediminis]
MKRARTAKQLTFIYFSILAFAIITFYLAIFEIILEDMEQLTAQNRMKQDAIVAEKQLENLWGKGNKVNSLTIPPFSHVYLDNPIGVSGISVEPTFLDSLSTDIAYEVNTDLIGEGEYEYYIMRTEISLQGEKKFIYLLHLDSVYEQSEEEVFQTQTKQLVLSFALLCLSLWIVLRISEILTAPLSGLSETLARRSAQDLEPIPPPEGVATREVLQLVEQLNQYQNKIHQLLERERAFNRYASHELRTPLMVIKGAVSLLGHSDDPAFIEKQRQRLHHASTEMNDFVSTLLSLTREEDISKLSPRPLRYQELSDILEAHRLLLKDKEVIAEVELDHELQVIIPETSLKILLGNLIKNAFACTEQGRVTLRVEADNISVSDTGTGLDSKPRGVEGFGLGLLIAHDICRKYSWTLSLSNNAEGGCTARIDINNGDIPAP